MFLPLNTAYTVDELSYFIENSGARMVVCDPAKACGGAPIAERLGARVEALANIHGNSGAAFNYYTVFSLPVGLRWD